MIKNLESLFAQKSVVHICFLKDTEEYSIRNISICELPEQRGCGAESECWSRHQGTVAAARAEWR